MKYALIGCGRISPNHIEAAKNNKLDFVAMCDIVPEIMQEKSEKFDLENVRKYTDYKELLEKEQPELVAIATESGKHAAIALDCIAAGCNVIIEKPIALSIADANAIIAAGKEKGVLVCANHQNRFNKSVQYTVAGRTLVGDDDAVTRVFLASGSSESDSDHFSFPPKKVFIFDFDFDQIRT